MSMSTKLITFLLFLAAQFVSAQYEISGQLSNYQKLWHHKIYLAYIGPSDNINSISSKQVINSTTIDAEGNFVFKGNNLPFGTSIVRVYLVKNEKVDVMLTGNNNFLLVVNENSKTHIEAPDFSNNPFDYKVTGDFKEENNLIRELESDIYNLYRTNNNLHSNSENVNQLIAEKEYTIIKNFCKADKLHPLVFLTAIKNLNLEKDYLTNRKFYKALIKKFDEDEKSYKYVEAFKSQLDLIDYENRQEPSFLYKDILIIILSIIIIIMILYIYKLKKKNSLLEEKKLISKDQNKIDIDQIITSLTKREREIFDLILQDYQNKEIAAELHLEVSTIKSHISKIYTKFDTKNRTHLKKLIHK